jgi:UDP-2,4-diacetamido-2,4,6-trideoxy-beta-L-altropyranose hydrolase
MFLCRTDPGNLCDLIEANGIPVVKLPSATEIVANEADAEAVLLALRRHGFEADLLAVDHYQLDERWERRLRAVVKKILVLDDLADRRHDCDVLLDPSLHDSPSTRYRNLLADEARVFVGPEYALLRPEFDLVKPRLRNTAVANLLVFFGGADVTNEALKVVHALRELHARIQCTNIVLGPISPHLDEVKQAASGPSGIEVMGATSDMAALMDQADLSLGTCGGAAWERCVVGLPALVVVSAENQRDDARILHSIGAVRNLGDAAEMTPGTWRHALEKMLNNPEALAAMSIQARRVMERREEAARAFEGALFP